MFSLLNIYEELDQNSLDNAQKIIDKAKDETDLHANTKHNINVPSILGTKIDTTSNKPSDSAKIAGDRSVENPTNRLNLQKPYTAQPTKSIPNQIKQNIPAGSI